MIKINKNLPGVSGGIGVVSSMLHPLSSPVPSFISSGGEFSRTQDISPADIWNNKKKIKKKFS